MTEQLYICERSDVCGNPVCSHSKPHGYMQWCGTMNCMGINVKCVKYNGDDKMQMEVDTVKVTTVDVDVWLVNKDGNIYVKSCKNGTEKYECTLHKNGDISLAACGNFNHE